MKGGLLFSELITTVSPQYAREIQGTEMGYGMDGDRAQPRRRPDRHPERRRLRGVGPAERPPHRAARTRPRTCRARPRARRTCWRPSACPRTRTSRWSASPRGSSTRRASTSSCAPGTTCCSGRSAWWCWGRGSPTCRTASAPWPPARPTASPSISPTTTRWPTRSSPGPDMFLMPSRFEPCGLTQMYAMRYGTVPVVRSTGGLVDTVEPWNPATGSGTGFRFDHADGTALHVGPRPGPGHLRATRGPGPQLMRNGMARDFSWERSAREYEGVYRRARRESLSRVRLKSHVQARRPTPTPTGTPRSWPRPSPSSSTSGPTGASPARPSCPPSRPSPSSTRAG